MSHYKIALVGCGRISKKHFDAIYHHRDKLSLVATCDVNLDRKANSPSDVPFFQSIPEMLDKSTPDIVVLCTPSGLHPRQSIYLGCSGVHVITEKPMATRWQDGLQMIKTFDEHQKYLFVVKQNRLNPTVQKVKQALNKGWFGNVHSIQSNVFWTRPQEYYDQDEWRGTWEYDGGALMNQASHYIDLLEWLGGPVESVQAMMATQARHIEVEDTAVVNFKFRRGALGSMSVSMLTYPKNLEGSITILGQKGSVKIGGVALNKLEHWHFETKEAEGLDEVNALNYETDSVYGNGHVPYYKNVIETLDGNEKPIANGREGLRSLELLVACYKSNQKKEAVHLPLEL